MGCDIHCYVEYKPKDSKEWRSLGGRINPGRNYLLFGIMAGVRTDNPSDCLIEPRGVPEDMGFYASDGQFIFISDKDEEGCCSMKTAERYVKYGSTLKNNAQGKPTRVSHPDWHSHSWITLPEFKACLERYAILEQKDWEEMKAERAKLAKKCGPQADRLYNQHYPHDIAPEYQAVYAAMAKMEELGYETRIVFWFDN